MTAKNTKNYLVLHLKDLVSIYMSQRFCTCFQTIYWQKNGQLMFKTVEKLPNSTRYNKLIKRQPYTGITWLFIQWSLRKKCPNTEFFVVRIFSHSDWIRGDTEYLSVFSPKAGEYGPERLGIWTLFTQC